MALNEVISSINMYYGIFPIKQFLTNLVYLIWKSNQFLKEMSKKKKSKI